MDRRAHRACFCEATQTTFSASREQVCLMEALARLACEEDPASVAFDVVTQPQRVTAMFRRRSAAPACICHPASPGTVDDLAPQISLTSACRHLDDIAGSFSARPRRAVRNSYIGTDRPSLPFPSEPGSKLAPLQAVASANRSAGIATSIDLMTLMTRSSWSYP